MNDRSTEARAGSTLPGRGGENWRTAFDSWPNRDQRPFRPGDIIYVLCTKLIEGEVASPRAQPREEIVATTLCEWCDRYRYFLIIRVWATGMDVLPIRTHGDTGLTRVPEEEQHLYVAIAKVGHYTTEKHASPHPEALRARACGGTRCHFMRHGFFYINMLELRSVQITTALGRVAHSDEVSFTSFQALREQCIRDEWSRNPRAVPRVETNPAYNDIPSLRRPPGMVIRPHTGNHNGTSTPPQPSGRQNETPVSLLPPRLLIVEDQTTMSDHLAAAITSHSEARGSLETLTEAMGRQELSSERDTRAIASSRGVPLASIQPRVGMQTPALSNGGEITLAATQVIAEVQPSAPSAIAVPIATPAPSEFSLTPIEETPHVSPLLEYLQYRVDHWDYSRPRTLMPVFSRDSISVDEQDRVEAEDIVDLSLRHRLNMTAADYDPHEYRRTFEGRARSRSPHGRADGRSGRSYRDR